MALAIKEVESLLKNLREKILGLQASLKVAEQREKREQIEISLNNPLVWADSEKMGDLNKEKRRLDTSLSVFNELDDLIEELGMLYELMKEGESFADEPDEVVQKIEHIVEKLEFQKMLGGKMDANNAILNINAGAGGRESQDWAVMILRMYVRWAERRGFDVEITDRVNGDDAAAIKSVTLIIQGDYAHGYLKAESGVHRLVRISPFDANKRRHTSFCSVFVTPEIDDSIDIDVAEKDLRVDTFRAGGAGGQHINKTDSAIRITHVPTNTVVQCQTERSQHKNRATAMKILRSKLYELEMKKKQEGLDEQEKNKMGIDFGSQIRSYVLHPYKMVKDHRTDYETGNADAILDGEEILDRFMVEYLLKSGGKNE